MSKNKILNLANSFSFLRLLLALPIYFAVLESRMILFWIVLISAILSDYLDGYFARKFDDVTELGKIIDPLADKVFVAVASIALFQIGSLPFWFIALVLARDILIFIGGIIYTSKYKFVIPSNKLGKLTVNILGLSLLVSYLGKGSDVATYLFYISSVFIVASFFTYLINVLKLHKSSNN